MEGVTETENPEIKLSVPEFVEKCHRSVLEELAQKIKIMEPVVDITLDATLDKANENRSCQTQIDKAGNTHKEFGREGQIMTRITAAFPELSSLDTPDENVNLHCNAGSPLLSLESDSDIHNPNKSTSQSSAENSVSLGCNVISTIEEQSSKDGMLLHSQTSSHEHVPNTENNQSTAIEHISNSATNTSENENTSNSASSTSSISENVNCSNTPLHHEHALNTDNQSTTSEYTSNSATFTSNTSGNEHISNSASFASNISENVNCSNTPLLQFVAEINLTEETELEEFTTSPTTCDIGETFIGVAHCDATELLPDTFHYPVVQKIVVGNVCNTYCDKKYFNQHIQNSDRSFHICENCTNVDCTSCDNKYGEADLETNHQEPSTSSNQFNDENLISKPLSAEPEIEVGKEEFELLFREEALDSQVNKSNKKFFGKGKRQAKKKQKKLLYSEPVENKNTIMVGIQYNYYQFITFGRKTENS